MDSNDSSVGAVTITDTLLDKVVAIIADLTGKNIVFTAYDVTRAVRKANATMNVPHADVREMVVSEYNSGNCDNYDKTLTELTVGQSANVYHPLGVSASTHPWAVKPDVGVDVNTDSDLTVENRLNISQSVMGRLNLTPGKLVKVSIDNSVISLMTTTDPSGDTLVVNADGRLRIGEKMLTEAFGRLPAKYDVSYDATEAIITVKPL